MNSPSSTKSAVMMLMPLSPGLWDLIHCIIPGKALGEMKRKIMLVERVQGEKNDVKKRNRGRDDSRLVKHREGRAEIKDPCDAACDVCEPDTSCVKDTLNMPDMFTWAEQQRRAAFCIKIKNKIYALSPRCLLSCYAESNAGSLCAKRLDGILKDAYIKVTKRLVREADSGIIKWIIHARKIDAFAVDAFNKLGTLRGNETQTKLWVN